MSSAPDLARVNLLLEFVSESAGLDNQESVLLLLGRRLPWILAFERLTVLVVRENGRLWWEMDRAAETLRECDEGSLPSELVQSLERVQHVNAPAIDRSVNRVSHPIAHREHAIGALSIVREGPPFDYRDVRILHHVAISLANVLERIQSRRDAELEADRARREHEAAVAKDRFLAMLGHELRNPLAPITTAVQLLKRRHAAAPLPEVGIIERQTQHLTRLVDDLLDVARVTSGKIRLQKQTLDARQVLGNAAEMVKPLMDAAAQVLEVTVDSQEVWIEGDAARLIQVLGNLLNNASRYSPRGSCIATKAVAQDGKAILEVADSGQGIAAEEMESIFALFVQGTTGKERTLGGLGLGLAVASSLIELHGGRILARSAGIGLGATFTIELPLAATPVDEARAASHVDSHHRQAVARRILLVDDNVDAADTLAELIRMEGHDVLVAYDPATAIQAAGSFQPNVVVLDIGLPGMSGHELARSIRAAPGLEGVLLIALSGYGTEADRARSRTSGFAAHLTKPADKDALLRAIELDG